MSEFQRKIFQRKLLEAEMALGFNMNEGLEEDDDEADQESNQNTHPRIKHQNINKELDVSGNGNSQLNKKEGHSFSPPFAKDASFPSTTSSPLIKSSLSQNNNTINFQLMQLSKHKNLNKSISKNTNQMLKLNLNSNFDAKCWSEFFERNEVFTDPSNNNEFQTYYTPPQNRKSPLFIFHHGAGSSGLTFAMLCKQIKQNMIHDNNLSIKNNNGLENDKTVKKDSSIDKNHVNSNTDINGNVNDPVAGFFSFDARGHGDTKVIDNNYSLTSFITDFIFIFKTLISKEPLFKNLLFDIENDTFENSDYPPIILVGHSFGGSVLTKSLTNIELQPFTKNNIIKGLVMFDIVEDTAVKALSGMTHFLKRRPKGFNTVKGCIDWHLKSNLLHNKQSALISIPALIKESLITTSINTSHLSAMDAMNLLKQQSKNSVFDNQNTNFKYVWKSDLLKTEPFWGDWFKNLSNDFVSAPVQSKLLILAGNDSLDKNLMIGQMQGKFQLIVFLESGHFLHEDLPNKTALSLIDFWKRNFNNPKLKIPVLWGKMRS
ncbi:phosphoprotein phosphatase methylesterase 1 ASCRUDRAFT_76361 [Ascoidea rubescens DSM 1968]|uniref:Protein phosphatase methylesterase 1 n=1 Tax=Ascoidea rubescens DSM 1968 TaxID=1344418 RepID=A0A1D2VFR9_9ASCO|nr:hypothetical protein ASCRUDRAFT_76361 [Ascoidea rubescens DSM 1968]ODV60363.1 hypothetical protein ASCRUDRAFT_76361 [Ascoidea rubescens DSM 1968]